MIGWSVRGKIIRTVLCYIVSRSCAQTGAHSYEQLLQLNYDLLFTSLGFFVFLYVFV